MPNEAARTGADEMRALRLEMRGADDAKIRRIIAMIDGIEGSTANQTILEPLRARLAFLKPPRALRFPRLVFIPLNPVIQSAHRWRSGMPAIPRNVLTSIAGVVRAGMGSDANRVDSLIAGHNTAAGQVITEVGAMLWPRAAEILATAPLPVDWATTGLRPAMFPQVASAIAAVLRRAPFLRRLSCDADAGVTKPDDQAIRNVVADIDNEHPDGCALIVRLVLMQAPQAFPVVRRYVASIEEKAQRTKLQKAMTIGIEQVMTDLDSKSWLNEEIGQGPLGQAGTGVRRIIAMLQELEYDALRRPRVEEIRQKLQRASRIRFGAAVKEDLVVPLATASAPVQPSEQTSLEAQSRDLRTLEMEARGLGGAETYEQLLRFAADRVMTAAANGTLSPVRRLRLIEILSGPDAAEALYRLELNDRRSQGATPPPSPYAAASARSAQARAH